MKIYLIYDNEKHEFVRVGSKNSWMSSGAAKNSIMCKKDEWAKDTPLEKIRRLSFNDQTRFSCLELDLLNVDLNLFKRK